jgi:hypothetical protein
VAYVPRGSGVYGAWKDHALAIDHGRRPARSKDWAFCAHQSGGVAGVYAEPEVYEGRTEGDRMKSARVVTYAPCPNAMPEGELNTLAAVYRLILDSHVSKKAAHPGGPDAQKETLHDSGNTSIPRAS